MSQRALSGCVGGVVRTGQERALLTRSFMLMTTFPLGEWEGPGLRCGLGL